MVAIVLLATHSTGSSTLGSYNCNASQCRFLYHRTNPWGTPYLDLRTSTEFYSNQGVGAKVQVGQYSVLQYSSTIVDQIVERAYIFC